MKPNLTRNTLATVLGGLGFLTLTALLATGTLGASNATAQAKAAASAPAPKAALTVTVVQPQQQNLASSTAANGSVAAWQELSVSSEAQGLRLVELRANIGDVVKKGQVLATFASETVQAEVAQARAAVLEAETGAALAKAEADRARSLQSTGALSAQQIAQMVAAEQSSAARVTAQKAMLQAMQLRLKQAAVLAPDSGIVTARVAVVGAVLPAGAELFRLIRQGRLEWRAEVTQTELERVQPGQAVQVSTAGGKSVAAKVRSVAPSIDPITRNGLVYVDLPAGSGFKAGMYAKGQFQGAASSALTLPASAFVLRDGFTYAMRVGADNKVAQVKVQAGRRSDGRVEVLSGVQSGQNVVASGAAFLADGDTVRVTK